MANLKRIIWFVDVLRATATDGGFFLRFIVSPNPCSVLTVLDGRSVSFSDSPSLVSQHNEAILYYCNFCRIGALNYEITE
jgi:hypothetical protein